MPSLGDAFGRKLVIVLQLVVLLLLLVGSCIAVVETETDTLELSQSGSISVTPPPTPSRSNAISESLTDSVNLTSSSTLVATSSDTATLDPGVCTMSLSSSFATATIPYQDVEGAPLELYGALLTVFEIRATDFSRGSNVITVALENGIFNFSSPAADLVFFAAKTHPLYSSTGPADTVRRSDDFFSGQKHGIVGTRSKFPNALQFRKTLRTFSIVFDEISSYRIFEDEWIFINFYRDASVPSRCATQLPVVLHITAHSRTVLYHYTQFVCFFVLLAGATASLAASSIPTSHHAAHVALLVSLHFAQEDGRSLGLPLHPLQVAIGDSKYRYVVAAIFCNSAIIVAVFLAQVITMFVLRTRGYALYDATKLVVFPRIFISIAVHLAPGTFYVIARNFGNQTTANFILCMIALVLLAGALFWGFHPLFSSITSSFRAKYVAGKPPQYSLLTNISDETQHVPHAHLTFLRRSLPELVSFVHGHWQSADATGTFMLTHGFTFENYTKKGKIWMGMELVDFFLVAMLTVFDNYTALMAFIQFTVTLAVKVSAMLLMIKLKPISWYHSSLLLFIVYAAETMACFALLLSSIRKELQDGSDILQDVSCAVASTMLLVDVGIVAARSIYVFMRSQRRDRTFRITDVTTDYSVALYEGFLEGSKEADDARRRDEEEAERQREFAAALKEAHDIERAQRKKAAAAAAAEAAAAAAAVASPASPAGGADRESMTTAVPNPEALLTATQHGGAQGVAPVGPQRGGRAGAKGRKGDGRKRPAKRKPGRNQSGGAGAATRGTDADLAAAQLLNLVVGDEPPPNSRESDRASVSSMATDTDASTEEDEDWDSAYDSDGLPILDHPRNLEREAKLVRGVDPDAAVVRKDNADDDDGDGENVSGDGRSADINAISEKFNVRMTVRKTPLWSELAESARGIVPRGVVLEGDYELL